MAYLKTIYLHQCHQFCTFFSLSNSVWIFFLTADDQVSHSDSISGLCKIKRKTWKKKIAFFSGYTGNIIEKQQKGYKEDRQYITEKKKH